MSIKVRARILAILLFCPAAGGKPRVADQAAEPDNFFRTFVGLSDDQIVAIRNGKAVAKILESRIPDEVFVLSGTIELLHTDPSRLSRVGVL